MIVQKLVGVPPSSASDAWDPQVEGDSLGNSSRLCAEEHAGQRRPADSPSANRRLFDSCLHYLLRNSSRALGRISRREKARRRRGIIPILRPSTSAILSKSRANGRFCVLASLLPLK